MSKRPGSERDGAILDWLDGELSESEQAELRDWLDAAPEHWQRFVELSFLHSQIADQLRRERSSHGVRLGAVQAVPEPEPAPIHIDATSPSRQQYIDALGYVLRHTFTPKRVAALAAAAVCAIGVILTIVLVGGPDADPALTQGPDAIAPITSGEGDDNAPTPTRPTTPAAVAVISGMHDAVWSASTDIASSPGTPVRTGAALRPGDRLSLTAGVAEITTRRGAIAILQAPATIALLESDNAVELLSGKLVGICESATSQGFVVRTPHMVVTDLGTRFGVDASQKASTQVHVIDGEVRAKHRRASSNSAPLDLTAGQAARASSDVAHIAKIDYQPGSFAALIEATYQSPDYVLAYWRFEDGTPGTPGSRLADIGGDARGVSDYSRIAARDTSGRQNQLYSFRPQSTPRYTDAVSVSIIPQTGQLNRRAIDDTAQGIDDESVINLYTNTEASSSPRPVESTRLSQWTVEASVKPSVLEGEQAFVSHYDRKTGDDLGLIIGLRGDNLYVFFDDGSGQPREIIDTQTIGTDRWVHLAATCDGKTLSLFAKADGEATYRLVGQTPVDRADMRRSLRPEAGWAWAIGAGRLSHDARALIDEVRISDQALSINQLLFSEPTR
jgi:hypothetical protein